MTQKKLVIVSESFRRIKHPEKAIPAIERYDGVYFRVLRRALREGRLRNTDILIVSEKLGLIWANDTVSFDPPRGGTLGTLGLSKENIHILRQKNLQKLERVVKAYSQIYVNVGRNYIKLIEGFENFATCKIVYAKGRGIGPKARHMKEWICSQ